MSQSAFDALVPRTENAPGNKTDAQNAVGAAVTGILPGAASGTLPQQITVFQPRQEPIPGATIFNTLGIATTAAVQADQLLADASQQIPGGCYGRIDSIVLYVDNLLDTSDIRFSVLSSGAPLPGFSRIRIFPGVVARANENFSVFYDVDQGALLTATFDNNDGGAYQVGVAISGWFWPISLGRLYQTQGQVTG